MCKRRLVENGIEIVSGSEAQEIIGEGDCRAVIRFRKGDCLIYCGGGKRSQAKY